MTYHNRITRAQDDILMILYRSTVFVLLEIGYLSSDRSSCISLLFLSLLMPFLFQLNRPISGVGLFATFLIGLIHDAIGNSAIGLNALFIILPGYIISLYENRTKMIIDRKFQYIIFIIIYTIGHCIMIDANITYGSQFFLIAIINYFIYSKINLMIK